MSYKKRLKGGWNQGKAYKGDSKERQHSKSEIDQQVEEFEAGDDFRYRHTKPRKRNMKEHLLHQISWYQRVVAEYKGRKGFWTSFASSFRDTLKKLKKKWKDKYGE